MLKKEKKRYLCLLYQHSNSDVTHLFLCLELSKSENTFFSVSDFWRFFCITEPAQSETIWLLHLYFNLLVMTHLLPTSCVLCFFSFLWRCFNYLGIFSVWVTMKLFGETNSSIEEYYCQLSIFQLGMCKCEPPRKVLCSLSYGNDAFQESNLWTRMFVR